MLDWTEICCAVDFSEASRSAVKVATSLAARLESNLTLLHVNEAALMVTGEATATRARVIDEMEQEVETKLDALQAEVESELGRPVRTKVVLGRAADEIARFVRDRAFDVLVIGTHGRKGMSRFIRGSVAEEVARNVDCPVLLVRVSGPKTDLERVTSQRDDPTSP